VGNHIWGNIYLYCWENKIDFRKVFDKLRDTELEAYKEGCNQFMIPFKTTKYESLNRRKLVGSTLEIDVDILTSCFHIPLEEIFKPQNYQKRLIELMKSVERACNYYAEHEFIHRDGELKFHITYDTVFDENYESLDNISIEYYFTKYYNEDTRSFYYSISVDLINAKWAAAYTDISMAYYNLNDPIYFRGICLYNGDSPIIAEYFHKIAKYDTFTEYKYEEFSGKNNITWISRTDEILSEVYSDDYQIIDYKSIVVKSAIRKCDNEEHHTKIVNGIFFTISCKTGEIKTKIIPLVYCQECNAYFMYDYEYDALRIEGRPLCKIYNHLHQVGSADIFSQLSTESIFKVCGYTVDANEGLSDAARHNLLDFLINRKIVTVLQTLNFLQWLINSRKNNQNMYNAVQKWESDFSYINERRNSSQNVIVV
jgi:hypothetical protein